MLHFLLLAPLALPATQVDVVSDAPAPPVVAVTTPRAFLGVQISETEGLGLRVDRVVEGSAAESAGLAVGDVLAAFNGTDLSDPEQLQKLIAEAGVGAQVRLTVLREDAVENLTATLRGAEPAEVAVVEGPLLDQLREVQGDAPQIVQLQGDLDELRGQLRELRAPVEIATLAPMADDRPFLGVYVGSEEGPGLQLEGAVEGSGAADAGIGQGDRLQSVGGSQVDDLDSLRTVLERYAVGDTVEVTVQRGDQSLDLLVELGGRPVEFDAPVELEEALGDGWNFEGFDIQELEQFDLDMDDFLELQEFEFDADGFVDLEEFDFDMDDFIEFEEYELEPGDTREFFFEVQDGQHFDVEELIDRLNAGDRNLRKFEWNGGELQELGDGNRFFLRTHPDGGGELFEFEWRDADGQGAFKGQGQNHFEHDRDGWHAGDDRMPDWARDMRQEMNEWRREMERDMSSLRERMGNGGFSGGRWSVRAPRKAPEVPRMLRLRGGAAPRTWVGRFSPDEGGRTRTLDVDTLHRHLGGEHGESHYEGHGERHEVHVDADGQRVERRFRGVRNGDGWDWTPIDGGAHRDVDVEIDRAVEHALRLRPQLGRNGQGVEVEVHVEHEVGRDAPRDHDHSEGDVDGEIEALKRRLDELEAQRTELRERLRELKQRR